MTKPTDEQLDSLLQHWQQQQPGMPASLRRQLQRQLAQPASQSLWQRRWREVVSLASCGFVALVWWQIASVPALTYQVVMAEQNGRTIEIHQLLSESSAAPSDTVAKAAHRRLAFEQHYQALRKDMLASATQQRLMQAKVDGDNVVLTDCMAQQMWISQELWQTWLRDQGLAPTRDVNWFEVSQGQQGQILALQLQPVATRCPAP